MNIFIYFLVGISVISSYRLIIGPTIQDRLVSLNTVSIISIVILALYSFESNNEFFLNIAISFLLLDFVGMVAFTKYLGREGKK